MKPRRCPRVSVLACVATMVSAAATQAAPVTTSDGAGTSARVVAATGARSARDADGAAAPSTSARAASFAGARVRSAASRGTGLCLVWTDQPGTEEDYVDDLLSQKPSIPNLDLIEGDMGLSVDRGTLRVRLLVIDMSLAVPNGYTEVSWRMVWSVGKLRYFAEARYYVTGVTMFLDGVMNAGTFVDKHQDTGSVHLGKGGGVEIDIPMAHINHPSGTLVSPLGYSFASLATPEATGVAPLDSQTMQSLINSHVEVFGTSYDFTHVTPQFDFSTTDPCPAERVR